MHLVLFHVPGIYRSSIDSSSVDGGFRNDTSQLLCNIIRDNVHAYLQLSIMIIKYL
jgi:hypothetical protein